MNLEVLTIIMIILGIAFSIFLAALIMKITHGSIGGIIIGIVFTSACIILSIRLPIKLEDTFTSDYDDSKIVATYKIFDMTSIDESTTLINYVDENKELKHIKSDKVKIFYDLSDDKEPYIKKLEYKRWLIYWTEIEVHIKE